MIQNYSKDVVLQEFFDFPRKRFQMRELSRKIGLGQPSVVAHLKNLVIEKLIVREEKGLYPAYHAHREDNAFKLLKKQNMVWRMHTSSLLEYLSQKINPACIVLFGSASRGEDSEESDIDLFVQAKESFLHVTKYEGLLHRKINILFEPNLKKLPKELLNNIINGQILYGYFKVF